MIFFALSLVVVLGVAGWRRMEYWGYLKMGEEFERQDALHREWKVGIPYDPRDGRDKTS